MSLPEIELDIMKRGKYVSMHVEYFYRSKIRCTNPVEARKEGFMAGASSATSHCPMGLGSRLIAWVFQIPAILAFNQLQNDMFQQ